MFFYKTLFVGLIFAGLFLFVTILIRATGKRVAMQSSPKKNYTNMHEINISSNDRILILAPHPDDAALSCSGLIRKSLKKGADVKVVYMTYGSHSSDTLIKNPSLLLPMPLASIIKQGRVRHDEAIAAMTSLGLNISDILFLGFPDSDTLKIWEDYFNNKSLTSAVLLTNKVIYKTAYKPATRFNAINEFNLLKEIVRSFKPTKIIYSDMTDLNPDHRATGLFLNAVLFDLQRENLTPLGLSYFVHAKDWPDNKSTLTPPFYFSYPLKGEWYYLNISPDDMKTKLRAIEAHKIPLKGRSRFLLSFIKKNELFFKPKSYSPGENFPLWNPKELQKIGMLNYVSNISVVEEGEYVKFSLISQPNISTFSKVYLFVYPMNPGKNFLDTPKYKIVLKRIAGKISVKLVDGRDGKDLTSDENTYLRTLSKNQVEVYMNKHLFERGDSFFFSVKLERLSVRVSETPWWIIKLS